MTCPICKAPSRRVTETRRGLCRRHLQMVIDAEVLLLNFADEGEPPRMCKNRRVWGPNWATA